MLSCIWSAEATSFSSLRASRIVGGLAGGLVEALGPGIVVEAFPEHQLARAMVVYVGLLAAGSSVGPIVAGVVASDLGDWRWFLKIVAILVAGNLATSLFMLPETTHDIYVTEAATLYSSENGHELRKQKRAEIEEARPTTGDVPILVEQEVQDLPESLWKQWIWRSWTLKYVPLNYAECFRNFYRPLQLAILPQVIVSALIFGLTIGWSVLTSIIIATTYSQPPLLWDARSVGLLSAGPLAGLLVGLPVGGALADYLFTREIRKSSGAPDPRTRLPAIIVGAAISPTGCLLLGYSLEDPERWAIGAVGWGMLSFGLTSSANILLTYSVHTIPDKANDIGALINLTKNSLAFAVSYASVSWTARVGPIGQFGTMAGLLWFSYLLVIPVWFFSNSLISWTARVCG